MSFAQIVAKVESAEKTVVSWLVKEYTALYQKEPEIEEVVDETINYVGPALVIFLDATGGAAIAPEVASVVSEAQSDLRVVSALIYDFGATPTAASIIAGVQKELAGLEAAGHVKDAASQAKLTLIINAVGTLATAIANAVAEAAAPKAA